MVWLGLVLTLVGLIAGFGVMAYDADHVAVNLLGLVPLGFLAMFAGIVAVLFGAPPNEKGPSK